MYLSRECCYHATTASFVTEIPAAELAALGRICIYFSLAEQSYRSNGYIKAQRLRYSCCQVRPFQKLKAVIVNCQRQGFCDLMKIEFEELTYRI